MSARECAWFRTRILASFLALLLLSFTSAAGRAVPTEKFAFILGHNEGAGGKRPLRYAHQDAQKIYHILRQLGDISKSNILLQTGGTAAQAWQKIRAIEKRICRLKHKAKRTLLLLYFSGHASEGSLDLGETSLSFSAVKKYLRASCADVRVAIIDSCYSGELIAMKGGHRGPSYRISVNDDLRSSGYAIITSSSADELSQESPEIRGSFFTHYLASALRGLGDTSGDGKVTLSEAYRYAYNRTVARTMAHIGGGQHPMYDFKLEGRGDIVLTSSERKSHLLIHSPGKGRLVIVNARGDEVLGEGEIQVHQPLQIAVAPGSYQVFLVTDSKVLQARVKVSAHQSKAVKPEAFGSKRLVRAVAKGGLFRPEPVHQLGLGFLLRRMPLAESTLALGAAATYRLELPNGWQPLARLTWSWSPDAGYSTGYQDIGGWVGGGYVFRFSWFQTFIEALTGYEHIFQKALDGNQRQTSAFSYLGMMGVIVPLNHLTLVCSAGAGGRIFRLRSEGWVQRLNLELQLGLGWKWGD